jgi:pimeloyl-ACP methyl ester carboxylesterase
MSKVVSIGSEKSTNGRSLFLDWKRVDLALRASIWPASAERAAAHLFATPRRHHQPDSEHVLLASARPSRVNGLAVWQWGSGPPVFLVHGWEGRGGQLGAFVQPLVDRGFSVVTFDARAHGASPGSEATLSDFSDALFAIAERFGAPRAVIAHSFGALGALLAAKRGLRTKALVLVAPPSPRERLAWFRRMFPLPDAIAQGAKRRIEARVGESLEAVEGAALASGLGIPGLVIHDREDRETAFATSEAITRTWPGSVLLATEGLGHRRILSDTRVVDRVAKFVAGRGELPESELLADHFQRASDELLLATG